MDGNKNKKVRSKIKISSVMDLQDFIRVSSTSTLIHKSSRDLWKIADDGQHVVRLYDDNGNPLSC